MPALLTRHLWRGYPGRQHGVPDGRSHLRIGDRSLIPVTRIAADGAHIQPLVFRSQPDHGSVYARLTESRF